MNKEIKINKLAKSITFINNETAFSQFGIADEILDLISNLQQENQQLKKQKDDAIEMLETYKRMLSLYSQRVNIFDLQDVIDELKGDSNE